MSLPRNDNKIKAGFGIWDFENPEPILKIS